MTNQPRARPDNYDVFARFYDLEFETFQDDLDLYRQFAIEANGPIVELGCGSGRVLHALLDTNLPLTGIDTSNAMIEIARSRLGPRVSLIEADMRSLSADTLPGAPFWMAFSAINTFLHLPDVEAQIQTLESLRSVVVPGGLLLLDLFVPDPHYLSALDGRLTHEFSSTLPDGRRLDKWASRIHDLALQSIDTNVWFDVTDRDTGALIRYADRYLTRYVHRFELEHLLHRTGWRVVSLFGSYDLDPYTSEAERMIVLASWGSNSTEWEG